MFVVDTSVTMAWCFEDESTAYTEAVLDRLRSTGAMAPAIWPLEVVNVLLLAERRQRVTQARVESFVQALKDLSITLDQETVSEAWGRILALGRQQGLTSYDAAYLELAMRQALPLATLDARLRAAALHVGVPLV